MLAIPAAAWGDDYVGAPLTHGPDTRIVAGGPTEPPPMGGPKGGVAHEAGYKLGPGAVRRLLPTQWCGAERATDDTADELNNGAYKYHAVYMIPADGADHFQQYATQIQSDAFEASALLEHLYGRAIRYDLGTNCGSQYLDISVVRMPQTTADLESLANTSTGTFDAVQSALRSAGFPTIQAYETLADASALTTNYAVWLDGPAPSQSCGQATIYDDPTRNPSNLNNLGGKVAAVFRNGGSGFCSSNAVRHEIGHNLGALQKVAPHAFDGMHCNDAAEDTMCYPDVSPQRANGQPGLFFDYHNDDYWDPPNGPPLAWWTVNLNQFLCADASCNVVPGATTDPAPASQPVVTSCSSASALKSAARTRAAQACAAPSSAPVRVSLSAVRRPSGLWRVAVRASGHGRAVIALRCRVNRGGQVLTVLSRRMRLPRTVRVNVRCGSRPRALAFRRSA